MELGELHSLVSVNCKVCKSWFVIAIATVGWVMFYMHCQSDKIYIYFSFDHFSNVIKSTTCFRVMISSKLYDYDFLLISQFSTYYLIIHHSCLHLQRIRTKIKNLYQKKKENEKTVGWLCYKSQTYV